MVHLGLTWQLGYCKIVGRQVLDMACVGYTNLYRVLVGKLE